MPAHKDFEKTVTESVTRLGGDARLKFRITAIGPVDAKSGPDFRIEYHLSTRDGQGVEQQRWVGKNLSDFKLSPTQKTALLDLLRDAQAELLGEGGFSERS